MPKLLPINTINIKGEVIKDVIFLNVSGGDKTIIIFESGKILLIPLYRECPVQFSLISDIQGDPDGVLPTLTNEKYKIQASIDEAAIQIEELKRWLGQ